MTKRMLIAALFTMLFLAALTVSVSADQDGNSCWCNNDQYGCWITGETGGRDYIMFWSESARDYIMGKGSKAPIVEKYSKSKLPLECGIVRSQVVITAPADSTPGDDDSKQENECTRCVKDCTASGIGEDNCREHCHSECGLS